MPASRRSETRSELIVTLQERLDAAKTQEAESLQLHQRAQQAIQQAVEQIISARAQVALLTELISEQCAKSADGN
jgi:hypothetical protein